MQCRFLKIVLLQRRKTLTQRDKYLFEINLFIVLTSSGKLFSKISIVNTLFKYCEDSLKNVKN